jgi:hypothetical protein
MVPATALVVASNCPSGYFGPDVHDAYYQHPSGMGWLAPLMFADLRDPDPPYPRSSAATRERPGSGSGGHEPSGTFAPGRAPVRAGRSGHDD